MPHTCPYCSAPIPPELASPDRELTYCAGCRRMLRRAEVADGFLTDRTDLSQPPPGAWFRREADGFEAGASTQTPAAFLMLIVFLVVAAADAFGWRVAAEPANHPFTRALVGGISLGIAGLALVLGWHVVLMRWGRAVVTVRGGDGTLFIGVGSLGWRRRFRWDQTTLIEERLTCDEDTLDSEIVIHAERQVRMRVVKISQKRQDFLLASLRRMLRERPAVALATELARHSPT